jgi:hypothetical protein
MAIQIHTTIGSWDRDEDMRLGHAELTYVAHHYNAPDGEDWQVLLAYDADHDGSLDSLELARFLHII